MIKSPKLYFYDTGLVCQLLRIRTVDQLATHPLRGNIFENFVIAECMKLSWNLGLSPALYFWRDQHGHEIDLMFDIASQLIAVEIKSSATFNAEYLRNLGGSKILSKNCEAT